jgi:hypothetical protein
MSEPKQQMQAINNCQMCFFIPRCLWMVIDTIISFDQHSHTHSLSLSLRYLAFFPHLSIPFISSLCDCMCINWNTDFTVLGCSHFIGSINTKKFLVLIALLPIENLFSDKRSILLWRRVRYYNKKSFMTLSDLTLSSKPVTCTIKV